MIFVCVWVFWWERREGSKEVGTWVVRDLGSQELREQTLRSPVSQSVEVSTGSGVCTLANWGPEGLFPQLLGPHIPLHSGAHIFDSFPPFPSEIHTHTNIIFSPFDVYFNRSHQFTMLVWESVFSWLAISKKADLWRHNSKQSDLFYSVPGCPDYSSPEYLILGWLSLPSLLILPRLFTLPHILVPFSALIQCLTCRGTEK